MFHIMQISTCTSNFQCHELINYSAGTKQACLFRDEYTPLTATGFSIYGLSKDSPKANTTFKTKQNLPYPLLCDTAGTLIAGIGLKKAPAGITRGVFVIDKAGKILAAEAGSPSGEYFLSSQSFRGTMIPSTALTSY